MLAWKRNCGGGEETRLVLEEMIGRASVWMA